MYAMQEKQDVINTLSTLYHEIAAVEGAWKIHFKENDFRPRIEHFQDALRAATSGEDAARLTVEKLNYDLSYLRYITDRPMAKAASAQVKSASTEVAIAGGADIPKDKRSAKQKLSELYKSYTVLFAAVFSEIADKDFASREAELDENLQDLHTLEAMVVAENIDEAVAEDIIDNLSDSDLEAFYLQLMRHKKDSALARKLIELIKNRLGNYSEDKEKLNKAHFEFCANKLHVYEASKDVIKGLAAKGLNLAGKFVENALSQSSGMGRGI